MASIKLYGLAASRAVRVIWMLHELGLKYEHDPLSFSEARLKQGTVYRIEPQWSDSCAGG